MNLRASAINFMKTELYVGYSIINLVVVISFQVLNRATFVHTNILRVGFMWVLCFSLGV